MYLMRKFKWNLAHIYIFIRKNIQIENRKIRILKHYSILNTIEYNKIILKILNQFKAIFEIKF